MSPKKKKLTLLNVGWKNTPAALNIVSSVVQLDPWEQTSIKFEKKKKKLKICIWKRCVQNVIFIFFFWPQPVNENPM